MARSPPACASDEHRRAGAGAAGPRRAGSAICRPAVELRPCPLHRVDASAAPALSQFDEPWTSTPPRRNRTCRAASAPSTAIQVNDPSSSRSKIPGCSTIPWIYIVEPGNLRLNEREVPILREFLLRGGTLTFDDFHGPIEWDNLESEMKRVFPDRKIVDLPKDHPIFSCFYQMRRLPADARPGIVPAGADVGEGRIHRQPSRDPGRQRPRHGPDQLEHRHGRRLGVVERGGLSGLRQVHRQAYRMEINEIIYSLTH